MTLFEMAQAALAEDRFNQDVTTKSLKDFGRSRAKAFVPRVKYVVVAKAPGVFAGAEWARAVAQAAGELTSTSSRDGANGAPTVEFVSAVADGTLFRAGDKLVEGTGETGAVLALERTLLNGLQYASGIATRTRVFAKRLEADWQAAGCRTPTAGLYHTRKTIPLSRPLALLGVEAGGGRRHRVDLSDRILFKENHKYFLDGALGDYVRWLVEQGEKNFLIEVENLDEAKVAVAAGARHLLLDNFTPTDVKRALEALPKSLDIEISGGLSLDALKGYCFDGVTRFSVGSLTRDVESVDLSLDWTAL